MASGFGTFFLYTAVSKCKRTTLKCNVGTELRDNMPSDLVIHVVGSKADLEEQREVQLEDAKSKLEQWLREDPEAAAAAAADSDVQSGGPTSPTPGPNPASPSLSPPSLKASTRMGLVGQLSFGPGRKGSDELPHSTQEQREPWCRADISEVSAKSDFGLSFFFF